MGSQLIPQIVINCRRYDTTGLQPTMMLLWACAGVPLGVYNIVENFNVALRIQPQMLTLLSLITWAQCKYYGKKWSLFKACTVAMPIAALMGGLQCGLIFGLRKAERDAREWPMTLMALLSACLLCAGVLRHYWDIYKTRTVRGISFIFVGIDAGGDLTSLISVFFQPSLDILGMVIYGSELVLWLGVFACGGYYNLRPWLKQWIRSHAAAESRHMPMSIYGYSTALEQETSGQSSRPSNTVFRTASSPAPHLIHCPEHHIRAALGV